MHQSHPITYVYDLVGNRISRTSSVAGVATSTSIYNANDQLVSETDNGVTTTYTYDSNGNTISTSNGTTTTTFTYDSQDRLAKQNAVQSNEVDIGYDGAGNRVLETVNGVTTTYLIDGDNPTGYSQVAEELVNGAVVRRYLLGLAVVSETQQINGAWSTSYYGDDGHGSVIFLTDSSGAVTDTYTFDAFGNKLASTGSTPNQILYSGQYLDPGTGNYDLRARVYNQNSGTFLTQDSTTFAPGDLANANLYVYAGGDPVNAWDPSGEFSIAEVSLTVAIGATLNGAAFGAIAAAKGASIGQIALALTQGAIIGGEAGIGLAIASGEGRLFPALVSGFFSGTATLAADALSAYDLGNPPPSPAAAYADFSRGFAGGVLGSALKGEEVGPAIGGLVTGLVSFAGQEIQNINSAHPVPLGPAIEDALVGATVSWIVSGFIRVEAVKRELVASFVRRVGASRADAVLNGLVGGIVATAIGNIIAVSKALL